MIENSQFSNNFCTEGDYGCGVFLEESLKISIFNTKFNNNFGGNLGSGVYLKDIKLLEMQGIEVINHNS